VNFGNVVGQGESGFCFRDCFEWSRRFNLDEGDAGLVGRVVEAGGTRVSGGGLAFLWVAWDGAELN